MSNYEYNYFDGEYFHKFNIVEIDESKMTATIAITYAEYIENYVFRKIMECPYCGETFVYDEYFDEEKSLYVCPHCNKEMDDSDFDPLTVYDYFAVNEYNVVFRINKELEYKRVEIMVGFDGPSVFVDTQEKTVKLSWWGGVRILLVGFV